MLATPALADTLEVQPIQVGAETVRYMQGVATVDLKLTHGAVQIRPLPMDHGSLAFAVAVYNGGIQPANIGGDNFTVQAGSQTLAVFSVDQLVRKANNRAGWTQFGLAMLGGIASGAAASQRDTYSASLYTPYGSYHSYYTAPSINGQMQANSIASSTGFAIASVQNQLDQTRDQLANDIVQLSTIDSGRSYGGKIIVEKIRDVRLPQRVTITVEWNGEQYPFAFQLAKQGTPAPAFTAITPIRAEQGNQAEPYGRGTTPVTTALRRPNELAPVDLERVVRRTAELMPRPTLMDDGTTISRFEATGSLLVLTAKGPRSQTSLSDSVRADANKAICTQRALLPLLHQGASIRADYVGISGHDLGTVTVTADTCGFW
ncbi:MAG: hypothetical protein ABI673_10905 [Novosphingobium sp.]